MIMANWDDKLYCSKCGGTNVSIMAWCDPNTERMVAPVNSVLETDDCWCDDCEEHEKLATLPELWERFSEIPVNNDDEIEQDFLCFEAGTSKFDVWHWFDERCQRNLHDDLMCNTTEDD